MSNQTMEVQTRNRRPCVNVKVRHGLEVLTAEQWAEIRSQIDVPDAVAAGFNREWCEKHEDPDLWGFACSTNFEQAEQDAKALFGSGVKCYSEGRSGGWLVVHGMPDPEDYPWDAEPGLSLKGSCLEGAKWKDGTMLGDDPTLMVRWAFFVECCAAYVADVPYQYASLLALNVYQHEEQTRPVEFLRAWENRTWDTFRLDVPGRVESDEDLTTYAQEHAPEDPAEREVTLFAVYQDPAEDA